ncbi:MAG: hypothetical protein ACLFV7_05200 [Phycisphaerae bacterium]
MQQLGEHLPSPVGRRIEETLSLPWGEVSLELTVPAGRMTLSEFVPHARSVSTQISRQTVEIFNARGIRVPCRKGCSACCRYLVPLPACEARCLQCEVDALEPGRREAVLEELATWSAAAGDLPASYQPAQGTAGRFAQWSHEYSRAGLHCPLLKGGLCTLYAQRPIACREHFVITPPQRCITGEGASPAPTPVSMLEALTALETSIERRPIEIVLLPKLHHWWRQDRNRPEPRLRSEVLAAGLVEALRRLALRATRQAG